MNRVTQLIYRQNTNCNQYMFAKHLIMQRAVISNRLHRTHRKHTHASSSSIHSFIKIFIHVSTKSRPLNFSCRFAHFNIENCLQICGSVVASFFVCCNAKLIKSKYQSNMSNSCLFLYTSTPSIFCLLSTCIFIEMAFTVFNNFTLALHLATVLL